MVHGAQRALSRESLGSEDVSAEIHRWLSRVSALLVGGLLGLLAGCEPVCIDEDLDGLGTNCALGPDCDDDNAARGPDCDAVPPPDCALHPTATGCPCLAGTLIACFDGPEGAVDVGLCRGGRARCVSGHIGACSGGVGPVAERCDGADQDCDGLTDEGALSPCGGCDGACSGGVWGGSASPFDPSMASPTGTLERTARGELTLTRHTESTGTVWVANSAEATVSRIDEERLAETARYATGAAEPSRVAIDAEGDAWIANRAFDGQSTLIEIAGTEARCADLNGNGTIETSRGPSEVLPFGADECVLRSFEVGAPREIARALAIDGDRGLDEISGGDLWVGLHDGQAVEEIDGTTGALLQRIPTPGFAPYAAAFDPWGTLYLISRDGQLARIDRTTTPPTLTIVEVPLACWLLYSLAIDREGRVALSGFSCDRATLYDPGRNSFTSITTAPSPRGAISGDRLYLAHTGASVSELGLDPFTVRRTFDLTGEAGPTETIGIALGRYVWAISRESAAGAPGVATAIDPASGSILGSVPVGFAPHTQGDLTGIQRFDVPATGSLDHVFSGCGDGMTRWIAVHVAADLGSNGTLTVESRHAATEGELEGASFGLLGELSASSPPYPLSLPGGGVLEVRVTLNANAHFGGPRLTRIGVEWACPGPD